jgi:hypothetical protein
MRRFVFLFLLLPLFVAGCNKGPAQTALTAAEAAVNEVKPDAEKFVPALFAPLSQSMADARAKFDQGDYSAALAAAKDVPTKAQEVLKAAQAKKDELTTQWNELSGALPAAVTTLGDKIGALETMKRLPKGFDATQLAAARTSLDEVKTMWTSASEAFTGGDLMGAVAKAGDVKAKAEALTQSLQTVEIPAVIPAKS